MSPLHYYSQYITVLGFIEKYNDLSNIPSSFKITVMISSTNDISLTLFPFESGMSDNISYIESGYSVFYCTDRHIKTLWHNRQT